MMLPRGWRATALAAALVLAVVASAGAIEIAPSSRSRVASVLSRLLFCRRTRRRSAGPAATRRAIRGRPRWRTGWRRWTA